jgi:biopolymer transport protein ExbB
MSDRRTRALKSARILALVLVLPAVAQAWWNPDWKQRTAVTLNTSAAGVETKQNLTGVVVPVRLHSGNFDFVGAKQDGSDLRVVAADDKTPLKFWVERFDSVDELGILWVQLPSVLPGTDKNVFYVYAGNDKASADEAKSTAAMVAEPAQLAVFHFAEKDGIATDASGAIKASASVPLEANGLIGQSAHFNGTAVTLPASDKLKAPAGGPLQLSFWIKPESVAGMVYQQGPMSVSLANAALAVQIGATKLAGGQVAPGTWSQIVVAAGNGKVTLFVNGVQLAQADTAAIPAIDGAVALGDGYHGLMDELEVSGILRDPEAIRFSYAAQSADAKLVASRTETSDAAKDSSGSPGYLGILFKSLTPDAWTVIAILAVMFLIALAVMVTKAVYVNRTDGANRRFLAHFRESQDVLQVETVDAARHFGDSSLYRLYRAGLVELTKRDVGPQGPALSGASMDAVKAAVDADSVREGYKLNAQMVLLTIAISGGPFLGLLGTVLGVMITFASIAAAGDVNVNAIAPGIAAALLATVAGLGVAIPSLFGYNYLASRIKMISSDMQIFVDEFVTRVAEAYGAR